MIDSVLRFCDGCHQRLPECEFDKSGRYFRRKCRGCISGKREPVRRGNLKGPESYLRKTSEDLQRRRRKEGNVEWHLNAEYLIGCYSKQNGRCALSGLRMTYEPNADGRFNASIDRIEPGGHYVPDNVRLVCKWVNEMKSNYSDSDFLWMMRTILEHLDELGWP